MAEIFISYTHRDNARLEGDDRGWVDLFHDALRARLGAVTGTDVDIWRDPKICGNDVLTPAIEREIEKSPIFLTVLSPGYMKSGWCQKELRVFVEAAKKSGALQRSVKSPIIKVIKSPVELNLQRETAAGAHFSELVGYRFYDLNERGIPLEIDPRLGPQARRDFCLAVNEVAYDIALALQQATGNNGNDGGDASEARTIYLAQSSFDLAGDRDRLRRELRQFGYEVLPDETFQYAANYLDQIYSDLNRSCLSIHPIGRGYGFVPDGTSKSIVILQYEAAVEVARKKALDVVPWIPLAAASRDERLGSFIEELRNDPRLFVGGLDDLKTLVHDKLERGTAPENPPVPKQGKCIYLNCDKADADSVKPYEDALFQRGFEVTLPLFDGDETQLREDHIENLKTCDAALIYYGRGTEYWFRSKMLDLRKTFGYGRTRPFDAKAVLLTDPKTTQKERFRSNELLVISAYGAFDERVVTVFAESFDAVHQPAI